MTHYIDIRIIPNDKATKVLAIRNVIRTIHGIQSKAREMGCDINVGVDFPEMNNTKTSSDFGQIIRIFGSPSEIMTIVTNSNIDGLAEEDNLIDVGRLMLVPVNVTKHVQIKRDRRYERAKRGEKGATMPEILPCFLSIVSTSSKKRFSMNLVRIESNPLSGDYSTYGFSCNASTVPSF